MNTLLSTVREVIKKAGGIETVAKLCGYRNANILRNQLCETNHQHKLGAVEMNRIIAVCKPHSVAIAQELASATNTILYKQPSEDMKQKLTVMEILLKLSMGHGELCAIYYEASDPDSEDGMDISDNELEQIHKKNNELIRLHAELTAVSSPKKQIQQPGGPL